MPTANRPPIMSMNDGHPHPHTPRAAEPLDVDTPDTASAATATTTSIYTYSLHPKSLKNMVRLLTNASNLKTRSGNKISTPLFSSRLRRNLKYTLLLDLDETLVRCDENGGLPGMEALVVLRMDSGRKGFVYPRPGVHRFLKEMSNYFELSIFTSATRAYAEEVIDAIDPDCKYIRYCLDTCHCRLIHGVDVKDLEKLGRHLDRTVIIDNKPENFSFQLDNGIPIPSWYGEEGDCELARLIPFLKSIVRRDLDVRSVIRKKYGLSRQIEAFMGELHQRPKDDKPQRRRRHGRQRRRARRQGTWRRERKSSSHSQQQGAQPQRQGGRACQKVVVVTGGGVDRTSRKRKEQSEGIISGSPPRAKRRKCSSSTPSSSRSWHQVSSSIVSADHPVVLGRVDILDPEPDLRKPRDPQ